MSVLYNFLFVPNISITTPLRYGDETTTVHLSIKNEHFRFSINIFISRVQCFHQGIQSFLNCCILPNKSSYQNFVYAPLLYNYHWLSNPNFMLIKEMLYSQKILKDPIFEDFKDFCLTLKILSSNFSKSRTDIATNQLAIVFYHNPATIASPCTYVRLSVLSACTPNCSVVTGCGHARLAATVGCSSQILQEGCTPEKKAQVY